MYASSRNINESPARDYVTDNNNNHEYRILIPIIRASLRPAQRTRWESNIRSAYDVVQVSIRQIFLRPDVGLGIISSLLIIWQKTGGRLAGSGVLISPTLIRLILGPAKNSPTTATLCSVHDISVLRVSPVHSPSTVHASNTFVVNKNIIKIDIKN